MFFLKSPPGDGLNKTAVTDYPGYIIIIVLYKNMTETRGCSRFSHFNNNTNLGGKEETLSIRQTSFSSEVLSVCNHPDQAVATYADSLQVHDPRDLAVLVTKTSPCRPDQIFFVHFPS